jgi:hypothetical protein
MRRIYERDQANLRTLQNKALEVAPEGDYDIAVTSYGDPDRGMPKDTSIEYRLRDDEGTRFGRIAVYLKGDHVEIYGMGERRTDTIRIEARSSNRIVLSLVPHDDRLRS